MQEEIKKRKRWGQISEEKNETAEKFGIMEVD